MAERRSYSKVYRRIWLHRTFRAFPDREKVMTLYLLSGPQTNRIGLFAFSLAGASEDLSWSLDSTGARLSRVLSGFSWEFDRTNRVIYIPSWWEFNAPGKQEKHFKGMLADLNDVPRTPLICKFCKNLEHISEELRPLIAEWETLLTPGLEEDSNRIPIEYRDGDRDGDSTETETRGPAPANGDGTTRGDGKAIHAFLKGFCDLYAQTLHGSKYTVNHTKDIPLVRRLLKSHGVDRLLKLSQVLFLAEDDWLEQTDRGIGILSSRINWLETRLRAAEAAQQRASA